VILRDCGLTLVIPYYDKWPRTKYLLESLNRQTFESFEVVIVDDGSHVPLQHNIQQHGFSFSFPCRTIRASNGGRSKARNMGAAAAFGSIVIFVDDDIILPPDFVQTHWKMHHEGKSKHSSAEAGAPLLARTAILDLVELTPFQDPETGEHFPFLEKNIASSVRSQHLLSMYSVFDCWDEFSRKRGRRSRLEKLIHRILNDETLSAVRWIGCVGGNISMDREWFLRCGGFDERFKVWGGEDVELGYRLVRNGTRFLYNSETAVYHLTHAHANHQKEREESRHYFLQKHGDCAADWFYAFLRQEMSEDEFVNAVQTMMKASRSI
jgi:GT2 family glycosyltransferase